MDVPFKTCGHCSKSWATRDDLLTDPTVFVIGYQVDMEKLEYGLLLFLHRGESCGTTMAVPIGEFMDLYTGPRFPDKRALTPGCPRYCIDEHQLSRCSVQCECAVAREAVAIVTERLDAARVELQMVGVGI
ncbi:MAG TPA: hypothetical protein VGK19_13115 [Capsulimonadaceae bacterium]|jgi:hypothetical protein